MMNAAAGIFLAARRKPKLPYDAVVEYLECNSTKGMAFIALPNAAIQSDYILYAGFHIIATYSGSGWGGCFTLYEDEQKNWTRIIRNNSNSSFAVSFLNRGTAVSVDTVYKYYDAILQAGKVTLNGRSYGIAMPSGVRPSTAFKIGPSNAYTWCRNHYFRIESSTGEIKYDLIPVRFTNEQGASEGAMYDRANPTVGMNPDGSPRADGLYRNRGTGAFLYGADKTA